MDRKLATIRVVSALGPIPGADLIEVATVDGWQAVVRKGDFKEGDKCLYFEIDSFLPKADERFKAVMRSGVRTYNGVEGHKLRTVRLRGQLSQGLALPLGLFPEVLNNTDPEADLAGMVGVVKWDPPLSPEIAGQAKGLFPSFIRKTDQERCQNMQPLIFGYDEALSPIDVSSIPIDAIQAMEAKGELREVNGVWMRVYPPKASPDDVYEVTVKLDGMSFTAYVKDDEDGNPVVGVCSRNLELKINDENSENTFIKTLIDSGLRDAMLTMYADLTSRVPDGRPFAFAVQGELMGPGIQGNREGFPDFRLFVFDIYDINQGFYLPPFLRVDIVNRLRDLGADIQHVPILEPAVKLGELNLHNVQDLLKYAEGHSINNPVREGVVFKRMDGQMSFKAISNLFLEQEKD